MCLNCGYYKDRVVIDMTKRKADREARVKATKERRKGDQAAENPAVPTTETK